jgi:hypothetical protein
MSMEKKKHANTTRILGPNKQGEIHHRTSFLLHGNLKRQTPNILHKQRTRWLYSRPDSKWEPTKTRQKRHTGDTFGKDVEFSKIRQQQAYMNAISNKHHDAIVSIYLNGDEYFCKWKYIYKNGKLLA